ncbi:MAG: molecular chaperone DnaK [Chloroflexi bacterium]|nr:MAG: molecular chaperone DnaK [Chloroflexota bacterium]
MAKVLGIDLGTTNSVTAIMEAGEPTVLENAEGSRLTPSVVAVNPKTGERLVGQVARRQAITNPENTIFSVKRFMGRKYDDVEVQKALKVVPYKVAKASNGDVRVVLNGKEYSPPEISAMILQKLKADAEAKLGEKITQAVITVPAYFNDSQRQATKDAGKIAGLEVLRIINEPTAASLAYGLDKQGKDETIAVYDLGGGTFDISILSVGEGVFEVKATVATQVRITVGGLNLDQPLAHVQDGHVERAAAQVINEDRFVLFLFQPVGQGSRRRLIDDPKHLSLNLTRSKLEQLVGDLVERTKGPVMQCMKDAGISAKEVNEVVLVGGQTRMPAVQEMVKQVFSKEPHKGVNPDEVVAIGAAIQAGVLKGEVKDILLLDVTPLTLGVETYGGVMTPMIPRNTTIPTSKTETYTTAADGQTSVEVHVLQGERPMATENKSLGRFILDGILPAPRGVPQIEVTFDIDANGILNVSAKDKATAKEQKIVIQSSSGLSDAEIQRMVKDAEEHAADDARRREEIEVRNRADSAHYQAEKMLREQGDKMPEQLRTQVAEKSSAVKRALDANDTEGMKTAMEELQQAMMAVGQAVYGAGEGAAPSEPSEPGANGQGGPGSPSGTVEGEYREV